MLVFNHYIICCEDLFISCTVDECFAYVLCTVFSVQYRSNKLRTYQSDSWIYWNLYESSLVWVTLHIWICECEIHHKVRPLMWISQNMTFVCDIHFRVWDTTQNLTPGWWGTPDCWKSGCEVQSRIRLKDVKYTAEYALLGFRLWGTPQRIVPGCDKLYTSESD
jgi:hypothetical protein